MKLLKFKANINGNQIPIEGITMDIHDDADAYFDNESFNIVQFVGAKDSSGKDVYEGDIVEFIDWKTGRHATGCFEFDEDNLQFVINVNYDVIPFEIGELGEFYIFGSIYHNNWCKDGFKLPVDKETENNLKYWENILGEV